MNSLPDGLADALGRVVAEVRQEFRKDVERLGTESRLIIAELRADVLAFKAELKSAAERELVRVPEALANLKDGAPGKDGVDGQPGADGADGKDGADGLNGKDADPELIQEMVTEAVTAVPIPKDGRDGRDADLEAVARMVAETVGKAVSALPVAKDGQAGADGLPGRDGRDGMPGLQGEKGIDGIHGKDGINGIDGLGFDDLSVEHDGERTVTLKFVKGERIEQFPILLPVPIYRGVYSSGTQYSRGDMVTFAGSTHVAEADTTEKPESGKDWRLAVKRGRDGRDGIVKEARKPEIVKV